LAYIDGQSKAPPRYGVEFKQVEDKAREQKLGIWSANLQLNRGGRTETLKATNESKNVTVSDISDASDFYIQYADNKLLETISKELAAFQDTEPKLEQPIKSGTPCVAKFSVDKHWYRARIEKVLNNGKYGVRFIDFGNYDEVSENSLRKSGGSLLQHDDQAKRCSLAFVKVPTINNESGEKAANVFNDLVWEKKLVANFVYEESRRKYCILTEKGVNDPKLSVNFVMISKGLAKVDRPIELPQHLEKLWQDEEDLASDKKLGIWTTNELEENDDE